MLSTDEIIELYDAGSYNIIIDKLQVLQYSNYTTPQCILQHAIDINNIDLISHICNMDTINNIIIKSMLHKPALYPVFQTALENKSIPLDIMELLLNSIVNDIYLPEPEYIKFISFISVHLFTQHAINVTIHTALRLNYLNALDVLFAYNYDVKKQFDGIMNDYIGTQRKIKLNTFIFLENHGIDILFWVKEISCIMLYTNDLLGLTFCMDYGVDVDFILNNMYFNTTLDTLKYLLDHGANLNKLYPYVIKRFIREDNDDPQIIAYLIENGANVDINRLLICAINENCLNIMKYLLLIGSDIHFENDLLLFYSAMHGKIKFVELLLEYGFFNNDILLFVELDPFKYYKMYSDLQFTGQYQNLLEVTKILIKSGIHLTNPEYVCGTYLGHAELWNADKELFTYFLNYNFDLNLPIKLKDSLCDTYILELAVMHGIQLTKLCLQYGANPYINNHSPLNKAIAYNKLDTVKLLLELGSTVNPELDYKITPAMVNLLATYQIDYKIKID